ncbi:Capsule synthesis protein, CapA [Paenibacillus curdlanolyticus YK9]|uniref:Capsule synthesis protein, CapA n=1 Tax=Paenibacillus curdlanolyticus YK9 TaxID=717606 RepID=E0I880_9BACL|nr:CapA family protein [Paenibacillus curdlanolyticus]EFM11385.1 Capsule synthesis protein, CapA [Paenibacillus curdlanolyticus YK9]
MASITVAAIGDLLMKAPIIASARKSKTNSYAFGPMFAKVAPSLRNNDIMIGNLETTFSGTPKQLGKYETRAPRTGYPAFNCPDTLASTLKRCGFDLMTTANNHCMDGGSAGLRRTLRILDQHGLKHTGTARTPAESRKKTIITAKGIRVGVLSYTLGTNSIPVPKPYMVNKIYEKKMIADLASLRQRTDFIIVCVHFGKEFQRTPNAKQRHIVQLLFRNGANAVLGAHPHVLQPVVLKKVTDKRGVTKRRVAAYSLGNFISTKLRKNPYTQQGLILKLKIHKDAQGRTDLTGITRVRTKVRTSVVNGRKVYRVVPAGN